MKADIDEAVITTPAISVNHAFHGTLAADNGLQRGFPGIGHNLGVYVAIAFEKVEHDGFSGCVAPTFTAYPAWSKCDSLASSLPENGETLAHFSARR